MKLRYKAVKRRTRMSAIINGNSKYARQYLDGDAVYAHGESLGLMVFTTLRAAEKFVDMWNSYYWDQISKDLIILKVIPIGRGKSVKWISDDITSKGIDGFYTRGEENSRCCDAPDNTMAYPGLHVLGPVYE